MNALGRLVWCEQKCFSKRLGAASGVAFGLRTVSGRLFQAVAIGHRGTCPHLCKWLSTEDTVRQTRN